jgi:antitoxin component YwqK of YwqJK toxin-antitoxin module
MDASPAGFRHNDHSSRDTADWPASPSFRAPVFKSTDWAYIFADNSKKMSINRAIMMQNNHHVFLLKHDLINRLFLCLVFCGSTLLAHAQTQKSSGSMEGGKKIGTWTYYYENGKTSAIEHFQDGVLHGTVEYFYNDGVRQGAEMWEHGLMEDSAKYFHKNGKLEKAGMYEHGQYAGEWKHYFANGKPERFMNYVNGLPEGPMKAFNEDGSLLQQGHYKNGKEDGDWKFYSATGDLEFTGSYREGKESGTWYVYKKGKQKIYKKY